MLAKARRRSDAWSSEAGSEAGVERGEQLLEGFSGHRLDQVVVEAGLVSASERPLFERLVHDLKGPLSPLQTAAYLLRRTELPADKRIELAETVERQARRMAGMIEELGDWVRAREGRLVTRRRPVELAYVVDLALGGVPQLAWPRRVSSPSTCTCRAAGSTCGCVAS